MATCLQRYIRRREAKKKATKDALFEQYIKKLEEQKAAAEAKQRALAKKMNPPRFVAAKERYPPVWKPIKESPEFKYGLIDAYVDWDQLENCHCILTDPYTFQFHHHNINTFLQHILETRSGYDVDCAVPECVWRPFPPEDLGSVERKNPQLSRIYKELAQAAFTEMNIHAEMNGESYAFIGLEKVVYAVMTLQVMLMTFTVKQLSPTVGVVKTVQAMEFARGETYLIGWRFKPEASAADCST